MAIIDTKLQTIVFPVEGFPAHLFVRDAAIPVQNEERIIESEENRWDFAVSHGEIVRDGRKRKPSDPDREYPSPFAVEDEVLVIPAGRTADFSCYFNMLSARKWEDLTLVENLLLSLDMQGEAMVNVTTYHMGDINSNSEVAQMVKRQREGQPEPHLTSSAFNSASFSSPVRSQLEMHIGHPDATLVGFSIEARSEVRLFGGAWLGSVDERVVREIDLRILTTTFRKEEYITRNVNSLKELMARDDEMKRHLMITVVDNGRTLNPLTLEDDNVEVIGNDNVGGAGGFARGMMAAIQKEHQPTHVIIMDDDVVLIPESIKRTYNLLKVLRPEYHDCFISGAMLRLDEKDVQHEDIGFMHCGGFYAPKKPSHRIAVVADCAFNEVNWVSGPHEYAAWWYCCVPMKFVSESSLPIPFFVRGDDVEFGLRNHAPIISMNGIGVWHMSFSGKFSAQMEYYQVIRNSFILCAFHPDCADVSIINRCEELCRALVCEFAYDYADLVLDAIEDYLSGPSIIEKPNGLDVIKEKGKSNEKMSPIGEVFDGNLDFEKVFRTAGSLRPDNFIKRRLARRTLNGHCSMGNLVRNGMGVSPYDWEYRYEPTLFKKRVLVVDPADATAIMRERDDKRFNEIARRKEELFKRYSESHERVEAEYRKAYPRFTSIDFWNEYLGLS